MVYGVPITHAIIAGVTVSLRGQATFRLQRNINFRTGLPGNSVEGRSVEVEEGTMNGVTLARKGMDGRGRRGRERKGV